MKDFYFEQNFSDFVLVEKKSVAKARLILIAILSFYLFAYMFGLGDRNIAFLALFFVTILFLLHRDNLKINNNFYDPDEKWIVSVVDSNFSWLSPKNLNETSFSVNISEIKEIQKSYDCKDNNSPYAFFFKNGDKVNPIINSSIHMDELIETLKERNVTVSRVSRFSRYEA